MNQLWKIQSVLNIRATDIQPTCSSLLRSSLVYTKVRRIQKPSPLYQSTRYLTSPPLASDSPQIFRKISRRSGTLRFLPGEEKHKLPVNALGSSSAVLVLTNAAENLKQKHRKLEAASEKPLIERSAKDGPSPADLLHSTEDGRRSVKETEIQENLEALRQEYWSKRNDHGQLTREHYAEAKEALRCGFTHAQLEAYLRSFPTGSKSSNVAVGMPQSTSLYICHAWTLGVSPFPETALARIEALGKQRTFPRDSKDPENSLHTPKESTKSQIEDAILSRCWDFKREEDLASLGELDLRISSQVRDLFFNLHKNGDRTLFAEIANEYGARIDASRSTGLLRITASYQSCQDTLRLIDFALEHLRSDTFEIVLNDACEGVLMPIIPAVQLEAIWANIARHTNTTITASRSKKSASLQELTVWSVGPSDSDFVAVQKLATRAIDSLKEEAIPLFHQPLKADSLQLTAITNAETLPWVRDKTLLRWRLSEPFNKREENERNQQPANRWRLDVPADIKAGLQLQSEPLVNELIPLSSVKPEQFWRKVFRDAGGSQEQHMISATFGLLAFSFPESKRSSPRLGFEKQHAEAIAEFEHSKAKARRLISGTANVSGLALHCQDLQPTTLDQLRIRLVPSIKDHDLLRERPPTVEISVLYDRTTGISTLDQIMLLSEVKYADLLMPEFHTDARFRSCQAMYQHKVADFAWGPIIQKFITDNKLDVWGSNLACVSLGIILPLPIAPPDELMTNSVGPSAQVQYHVISLDYRSQLRFNAAGVKAVYSRIASNGFEGRREELVFETTKPISTSAEDRANAFQEFYTDIITWAHNVRSEDYLHALAVKQPKDSRNRARAEQLLSELMRSTAMDLKGGGKRIRTGQGSPKSAVEEEMDLLLGSRQSSVTKS